MPSPQALDIAALLTPIPGDNPAGGPLRYAGPYDAIQEARRADDLLDQGEWEHEIKIADWPTIIEIATDALATKSKDLQIAVWLVEALVKRHGFSGLRDGLQLLRELQEQFWVLLYPEVEDGDLGFRAAPLEWLNEKLPPSIRQIPVTHSEDRLDYSWLRWKESREVDNLGRQSQEALEAAQAEGKITGEQFDKAVTATPRTYYEILFEDLSLSKEECERLERLVDEKFGQDAPSLLGIKTAIEECHTLIHDLITEKRKQEPEPTLPESEREAESEVLRRGEETLPPGSEHGAAPSTIPLRGVSLEPQDRPDALRRLAAVAAYFHRTEPHSPVAYLVERAVRWGEMPLDKWLQDVISDDSVLAHVRETLGLRDSEESE